MLIAFFIGFVGLNYSAFFLDKRVELKIISIPFGLLLIRAIFLGGKKLIKNEAILTIMDSGIDINEKGRIISLDWTEVDDCKINLSDDTNHLIIKTWNQRRKIDITWLDKKPEEIEEIISQYLDQKN